MSTGSDATFVEIALTNEKVTYPSTVAGSTTVSAVEAPVVLTLECGGNYSVKTSQDFIGFLNLSRYLLSFLAASADAGQLSDDFMLSVRMSGTGLNLVDREGNSMVSIFADLEIVGLTESDFLDMVEENYDPTDLGWLKDPTTVFNMTTNASTYASSEDPANE